MTEAKLLELIGYTFEYDSLNRKTEMRDPDLGFWMYKYDTNGNLVEQSGGGGNLISGDGFYREYDTFGQLSKIRNGSTNTSPLLEQYFYDADGQRIKTWKNDSANTTIYTPFKELMRIVNLTGSYDFTYIYDGDTQVARKNPDGTIEYDHTDHLGSVGVITNSTASVVENTLYSPFGEELSGGNVDVKGYTGQFDDEATGQMYYGARYYKPGVGLFIGPDSVIQNGFDPQFLNHYAYVRNNPYKYNDPTGKDAILLVAPEQAGGYGHVALIIGRQDEWHVFSQGAIGGTGETGTGLAAVSRNFEGGVYVSPPNDIKTAISILQMSSGGEEYHYTDYVYFQTTETQDALMFSKGLELQHSLETGDSKYQALSNNCADFTAEVLAEAEIKTATLDPRPNKYFEKTKEKYNELSKIKDREKIEGKQRSFFDKVKTSFTSLVKKVKSKVSGK